MADRVKAALLTDLAKRGAYDQGATAFRLIVWRKGSTVINCTEGRGTGSKGQAPIHAGSRFNIYSIRKAYLGLAVSCLIESAQFPGLDDPVRASLPRPWSHTISPEVTFRHLVTHTHGLIARGDGTSLVQVQDPGTGWHYNNAGVYLLCQAIQHVTGMTAASAIRQRILNPLGCHESRWQTHQARHCVRDRWPGLDHLRMERGDRTGIDRNFYVSAHDLLTFARLHLDGALGNDHPLIPHAALERVLTTATPSPLLGRVPHHGMFWWLNARPTPITELGEKVPPGSFQISGMNGSLLLVMPRYQAIVIRLMNTIAMPPGYDRVGECHRVGDAAAEFVSKWRP